MTPQDGDNNTNVNLKELNDARFAVLNHLIMRDLNNSDGRRDKQNFFKYNKDKIAKFLSAPDKHERELRNAVRYIYGASPHFRRVIQYFTGLSDLAYLIEPYRIDARKANVRIINNNYRKVLNMVSSIDIQTQIPKLITICLREDIVYCTMWQSSDNITIQILPSDYCAISSIEGNVFNVTFDFSYFDSRKRKLDQFPAEFRQKYENEYCKNRSQMRWIELDSPTSFAVKCNSDIPDYAMPPFAGILREIYDLEDYRSLKLAKKSLENYAMLAMTIPMSDDGEWGIDLDKAEQFWRNLDAVLPEEVGSVLTPMPINKISFEKSNTGDTDTIAEAEQNLFTAAGVSSLLFNNASASSNALLLSIKADQAMTYGIVKSIGDALNRFIQDQPYGKNFRINFLDISPYNRKEMGDAYLKAASYGLPTISAYAASQGIGQAELDNMSFLETQVLGLQDLFVPLRSSTQMSSDEIESQEGAGAPEKDIGELTDSGETTRELGDGDY